MKTHVYYSDPHQKPHEHPLQPHDAFCRQCGLNVLEIVIGEAIVCAYCRRSIADTDLFCSGCGQEAGTITEESYVFLGVPLKKEDYELVASKMKDKEYSLERNEDEKGWRIKFKEKEGMNG